MIYVIIDQRTGEATRDAAYQEPSRARRRVDRLDNAYGAYRYRAKGFETTEDGRVWAPGAKASVVAAIRRAGLEVRS